MSYFECLKYKHKCDENWISMTYTFATWHSVQVLEQWSNGRIVDLLETVQQLSIETNFI